jgi:cell division protein FtsL
MSRVRKKKMPNGITFGMISVIVMVTVIALILTLIKIYLSNQIYYESKKVNKIQREVNALRAQNKRLIQKVESLRFKQRVLDPIAVETEVRE